MKSIIDRLVQSALANPDGVRYPEKCLLRRSLAAVRDRPFGAFAGHVHGGGMARRISDAPGTNQADSDAGIYFDWTEIKAAYVLVKKPQPARPSLNEVLARGTARWFLGTERRWRARCESALKGTDQDTTCR